MGTISDKLTYLNGTKQAIKDELNRFGAGLDNEDTFRSYSNVLNDIYDKLPKVSGNGSNFSLENAQNGKLDSFGMDGNTEQTTYSGKNLLNTSNEYPVGYSTTINGITFTINNDKTITANGTATGDNARFTFIENGSILGTDRKITAQLIDGTLSGQCAFFAYDGTYSNTKNIQTATDGSINNTELTSSIEYAKFRITVYTGTSVNNAKIGLMVIDTSETNLSYEPYVGGTASPNPDYPQNINVVSGNQVVNVSGKNLFDIQSLVKGRLDDGIIGYANNTTDITLNDNSFSFTTNANYRGVTSDFIKAEPNVDYIVSAEDISGVTTLCACYDSNKVWLGNTSTINIDSKSKKYTTLNNTAYIRVSYQLASSGTITVTNPQIEQNPTATTYEPYHNKDYEIDLHGKNLFDKNNVINGYRLGSDGLPYEDSNYSLSDFIKVEPDSTYYRNITFAWNMPVCLYDKNKDFILRLQSGNTVTTTDTTYYLRTAVATIDLDTVQLEKGSIATEYEEFYDYKLCKIDTYKDSIKKSTGKNLFDGGWSNGSIGSNGQNISDSKSIRTTGIVVKSGVQYTFSSSTTPSINEFWINYYNGDTFVSREYFSSGNTQTFIVPSGVNIVRFRLTATTNIDTNIINNVQLEQNSQATDYEPYGTDWYIKKEIGKVVLDGSENWSLQSINDYGIANFQKSAYINDYVLGKANLSFNNYFSPQTSLISSPQTVGYFLNTAKILFVRFKSSVASTTTEFKNWLNTHNMILYYALETPTYETITDETLINQLEAIETETGTNIFEVSNDNDVLPSLNVKRLKELEKLS